MTHDTAGSGAHGATFAEVLREHFRNRIVVPVGTGMQQMRVSRWDALLDGAQPTEPEATSLALALGLSGGAYSDWMAAAGYAVDGDGA